MCSHLGKRRGLKRKIWSGETQELDGQVVLCLHFVDLGSTLQILCAWSAARLRIGLRQQPGSEIRYETYISGSTLREETTLLARQVAWAVR